MYALRGSPFLLTCSAGGSVCRKKELPPAKLGEARDADMCRSSTDKIRTRGRCDMVGMMIDRSRRMRSPRDVNARYSRARTMRNLKTAKAAALSTLNPKKVRTAVLFRFYHEKSRL